MDIVISIIVGIIISALWLWHATKKCYIGKCNRGHEDRRLF